MPDNMQKYKASQLKIYQDMPLQIKINLSISRIKQFYDKYQGNVYIAFSGGKDSTVMLDLVRRFYPHVPAVFCNTGLEYPEILKFIKTIDNIIWLRPKITFKKVLEKYGYPIISKDQARAISRYKNAKNELQKYYRLNGFPRGKKGMISKKWQYLVNAPFKISDYCCTIMKENPLNLYVKKTNRYGYIGIMASDSNTRLRDYMKYGCNAFDKKTPQGRPLMFWKESDIWEYIHTRNLPYSTIYDMEYTNTGCIFCAFGAHLNYPNRFQLMKKTHPKLWEYCMKTLRLAEVLDYCNIPYQDYYIQNSLL